MCCAMFTKAEERERKRTRRRQKNTRNTISFFFMFFFLLMTSSFRVYAELSKKLSLFCGDEMSSFSSSLSRFENFSQICLSDALEKTTV